MKPPRALRIVGARLQTITGDDITPVVDSVTSQIVLAVSISIGRAAALRGVRLAHTVESRRRAALADVIADFTAVAVCVRDAFDAAAVGIAHQTVRALGVVAARHAAITAADRATWAVRTPLASKYAHVRILVAGQGT